MANYERGSTEDDVPVFDGGEDDETEGSHLPVVIAITVLVLAAFGGVVWLAYNQGVARGRNDAPTRVAVADTETPAAPAGGAAPHQIKIYQQPASPSEDGEAVPPPPPSQATSAPPPPVAVPPLASGAPPLRAAQESPAAKTLPPPARAAAASIPPKVTSAPPVATAPPAQLGLAVKAPKPAVPVKLAEPPKPITAAKPVAAAPGAYVLQIGAYKSQDEAMAAWNAYRTKHGALLSGMAPDVQKADLGAKGTWYRLRTGSFADKGEASALCDKLKADNGACFLAK